MRARAQAGFVDQGQDRRPRKHVVEMTRARSLDERVVYIVWLQHQVGIVLLLFGAVGCDAGREDTAAEEICTAARFAGTDDNVSRACDACGVHQRYAGDIPDRETTARQVLDGLSTRR